MNLKCKHIPENCYWWCKKNSECMIWFDQQPREKRRELLGITTPIPKTIPTVAQQRKYFENFQLRKKEKPFPKPTKSNKKKKRRGYGNWVDYLIKYNAPHHIDF